LPASLSVFVQDKMRGMLLGNLTLPASRDEMTEACLELLSSPNLDGKTAVFENFANIQWTRVNKRRRMSDPMTAGTIKIDNSNIADEDDLHTDATSADFEQDDSSSSIVLPAPAGAAEHASVPVAMPAPGLDLSGRYSWVRSVASSDDSARRSDPQDVWTDLRLRNGWTDGQHVLESMFSPYDSEGIEECTAELHAACRPPL
jgi:hypothetical protein